MACWTDLPPEIKVNIFQRVFDTSLITYKPSICCSPPDAGDHQSPQFLAPFFVSKRFATADELNTVLFSSSTLVFRAALEIRCMFTKLPVRITSTIRSISLINCSQFVTLFSFADMDPKHGFDNFQITEHTIERRLPCLQKITISPTQCHQKLGILGQAINLFEHTMHDVHDDFPSEEITKESVKTLLKADTPDSATVIEGKTHRYASSFICGILARRKQSSSRASVYKWVKRLVKYAVAKNIEVIFQVSCEVDLYYYYSSSENLWAVHCRKFVGTGNMSTHDWMFQLMYEGQKYTFYQDSARQLLIEER